MRAPALLAIADGPTWPGVPFGAVGVRTGEIVFNTSLTGSQEILTDPSYHGQIVVMSQPHGRDPAATERSRPNYG